MTRHPILSAIVVFIATVAVGYIVLSNTEAYNQLPSFKQGHKLGETFGTAGILLGIGTWFLLRRKT